MIITTLCLLLAAAEWKTLSEPPFELVYSGSDKDAAETARVSKNLLTDVYPKYFDAAPPRRIKIILYENSRAFRAATGSDAYGYYTEGVITTYHHSGIGTLWHELMHAFVDHALPCDPHEWFNEGLASFYEMAGRGPNGTVIEGFANWRHPVLQQAIADGAVPTLERFMKLREMRSGADLAQARFLFVYLWTQKQIAPFVRAYTCKDDAYATLKTLIPKDDIDADFIALAKKTKRDQKLQQVALLPIEDTGQAPDAPSAGYCGEAAIQQALRYYGREASQHTIYAAGGKRHPSLYADDLPRALEQLGVPYKRAEGPFLDWVEAEVRSGHPVLIGVKIYPSEHPQWELDHFVLVVGVGEDGFVINTTWKEQVVLSRAALQTADKGLSLKNRSGTSYGIAIMGRGTKEI